MRNAVALHAFGVNGIASISVGTQRLAPLTHSWTLRFACSDAGTCAVGMHVPSSVAAPSSLQHLVNSLGGLFGPGSQESLHAPVAVASSGL